MKIKYRIITSVLALLLASSATAGQEGRGGHGIRINGVLYLWDLVESGVHMNPYNDPSVKPDADLLDLTTTVFSDLDQAPVELVAQKLTVLRRVSFDAASVMKQAFHAYSWSMVGALIDVPDPDTVLSGLKGIPLAVRRDRRISIEKALWTELDASNKAALLLHEVLYALSEPKFRVAESELRTSNGNSERFFRYEPYQDSAMARALTAALFQKSTLERPEFILSHFKRVNPKLNVQARSMNRDDGFLIPGKVRDKIVRGFDISEIGNHPTRKFGSFDVSNYLSNCASEIERNYPKIPTVDISAIEIGFSVWYNHQIPADINSKWYGYGRGNLELLPLDWLDIEVIRSKVETITFSTGAQYQACGANLTSAFNQLKSKYYK